MAGTNKNVTKIFTKTLSDTWVRLHDTPGGTASHDCSEFEVQNPSCEKFRIAIGYEGAPECATVYWEVPAKDSDGWGPPTQRFTGVTNTSEISAWVDGTNKTLQFQVRYYNGHVQTG